MFPGRYGRRNVVNHSCVVDPCGALLWSVLVGLLVQILDGGRARGSTGSRGRSTVVVVLWVGVGDKPSAY